MLRIKKSKKSITKKLNYTVSSQNRLVFLRRRKLNLMPDFSICIYIILDNAELTRLVPKFVTSDTPNFITFDDGYSNLSHFKHLISKKKFNGKSTKICTPKTKVVLFTSTTVLKRTPFKRYSTAKKKVFQVYKTFKYLTNSSPKFKISLLTSFKKSLYRSKNSHNTKSGLYCKDAKAPTTKHFNLHPYFSAFGKNLMGSK